MNLHTSTLVLLASPHEEDHRSFSAMLAESGWALQTARSCAEAWQALHREGIAVVVAEADFPDGCGWKDLLAELNEMPDPPPLIVTSLHADNRLWAEVLNLGGYDLLMKPLERNEVLRTIGQAWRQARDARRHDRVAATA